MRIKDLTNAFGYMFIGFSVTWAVGINVIYAIKAIRGV